MKHETRGVGGCLLVLCIWMIFVHPFITFTGLHRINNSVQLYITLAIIAVQIMAGIALWSEKPIGWRIANAYYWILFTISGFGLIICLKESTFPASYTSSLFFGGLFLSLVFLVYLNSSKRVANTFFQIRKSDNFDEKFTLHGNTRDPNDRGTTEHINDDVYWRQVSAELKRGELDDGLWLKVMTTTSGTREDVERAYVLARVAQLNAARNSKKSVSQ